MVAARVARVHGAEEVDVMMRVMKLKLIDVNRCECYHTMCVPVRDIVHTATSAAFPPAARRFFISVLFVVWSRSSCPK